MPKPVQEIRIAAIGDKRVPYEIRRSSRARYLRVTITLRGSIVVTVPRFGDERLAKQFLMEKAQWILKHLARIDRLRSKTVLEHSPAEYEKNKDQFLVFIRKRIDFFNSMYRFSYRKIRIGNQTSLWGSCTRAGNLQFNYKLRHLPEKLIDYVVVHELCHLKEHNHGRNFWALVSKTVPNHKEIRRMLRGYIMNTEML